jgi:hypothetical protein
MRLWIMSDIHLKLTRGWDLPFRDARPDFDVLIVAGDLIPRAERGVRWLLERVPDRPVIYLMGNHEAYGVDIDRTIEKAIRECEEHGWMLDRGDPYARERAFDIAREDPPPGVSSEAAAVAIAEVLDGIGDTCPECPKG